MNETETGTESYQEQYEEVTEHLEKVENALYEMVARGIKGPLSPLYPEEEEFIRSIIQGEIALFALRMIEIHMNKISRFIYQNREIKEETDGT